MSNRNRSRGSTAPGSFENQYIWDSCSTSSPITTVVSTLGFGELETMTDTVVPNFNERRRRGEVFFNPMSHTWLTLRAPSGSGFHVKAKNAINCGGVNRYYEDWNSRSIADHLYRIQHGLAVGDLARPEKSFDSSILNDLVTEAGTRVRSQRGRSKTNLYESLAEVDRTLGILPGLLKSAQKVVKAGQRRADRNSRRAVGAAESYLSYAYGIRPLISDISGVLSGVQKKMRRIRETSRSSTSHSYFETAPWIFTSATATWNMRTDHVLTANVRAMSLDEYYADLGFNLGFSTKNLLTLPWELVPYSFVVDWFVNIGDVIGSLVPSPGFSQLGSCYVVDTSVDMMVHSVSQTASPSNTIVSQDIGYFHSTLREKTRRPGLPLPGVVLKSDFRFDNVSRVLEALSLLILQMKKIR